MLKAFSSLQNLDYLQLNGERRSNSFLKSASSCLNTSTPSYKHITHMWLWSLSFIETLINMVPYYMKMNYIYWADFGISDHIISRSQALTYMIFVEEWKIKWDNLHNCPHLCTKRSDFYDTVASVYLKTGIFLTY